MDLKEAFRLAMKGEIEGRELYSLAAEKTDDEKAKEVFGYLAREEDSHLEALKILYRSLVDGEEMVPPVLPRLVDFKDAGAPIFSDTFKERLTGKHFEMSVLSIGLKLEKESFEFYEKTARELGEGGTGDFFLTLAEWEKDHYDALSREMTLLEEDFFTENDFAPF